MYQNVISLSHLIGDLFPYWLSLDFTEDSGISDVHFMFWVSVDSWQVNWNICDARVLYMLDALDQVIIIVRIELQGGRVNFLILTIGIVLF